MTGYEKDLIHYIGADDDSMDEDKECCGTCKYHKSTGKYCEGDTDYVCMNNDSEYCTDYTEYSDCCDEYEKR